MLKDNNKKKTGNRTKKFYDKVSAKKQEANKPLETDAPIERPKKKTSLKKINLKDMNKKKVLKIFLIGSAAEPRFTRLQSNCSTAKCRRNRNFWK